MPHRSRSRIKESSTHREHKRRKHRHRSSSSDLKDTLSELRSAVSVLTDVVRDRLPDDRKRKRSRSRSASVLSNRSEGSHMSISSHVSGNIRFPDEKLPTVVDVTQSPLISSRGASENEKVKDDETVDSETLALLGDNPEVEAVYGPEIHEELTSRWTGYLTDGLNESELKTLLKSHSVPVNFKLLSAPKLNPEIEAVSSEFCIERDRQLRSFQQNITAASQGIGNALTLLLKTLNKESKLDKTSIIKDLSDSAKILLHTQCKITAHRKKLITPKTGVLTKIASEMKTDEFLFGVDLKDKTKNAEDLIKLGNTIVKQGQSSKTKAVTKKIPAKGNRPLNYNRPSGYLSQRYKAPQRSRDGRYRHRRH